MNFTEICNLRRGNMIIEYGRYIIKDDKKYLRVTEVFKPFSGISKVPPEILQYAADIGTNVHAAAEAIIHKLPVPEHFEGEIEGKLINSFEKWYNKWEPDVGSVIRTEERFFDDALMITGQIDLMYAEKAGGGRIVDYKTSTRPQKTWDLQASAYIHLARLNGYNVDQAYFLHLQRDGSEPKVYSYKYDLRLFLACLDVYRYFYE